MIDHGSVINHRVCYDKSYVPEILFLPILFIFLFVTFCQAARSTSKVTDKSLTSSNLGFGWSL